MSDSPVNVNTSWLDDRGSWAAYILIIAGARYFLQIAGLPIAEAWCTLTIVHGIFTLLAFHFAKGSPTIDAGDDLSKYTWWEQIDHGEYNTANRKFLTLVPLVLLIISYHFAMGVAFGWLLAAGVVSAVVIIAKLPFMHGQRLFGMNRSTSFTFPSSSTPRSVDSASKKLI